MQQKVNVLKGNRSRNACAKGIPEAHLEQPVRVVQRAATLVRVRVNS